MHIFDQISAALLNMQILSVWVVLFDLKKGKDDFSHKLHGIMERHINIRMNLTKKQKLRD